MTTLGGVVRRRLPTGATVLGLLAALVAVSALALTLGSVRLPLGQVWGIVLDGLFPGLVEPDWSVLRASIIWESRLPRVLLAVVVGAALALSGAVAQVVTRNPLADPYLLGVSSGAGLMVTVVVVLGIGSGMLGYATLPVAAFLGGLGALLLVLAIAGRFSAVSALVLGGLAVGQVCYAAITLIIHLASERDHAVQVMFWLSGGLGDARWETLVAPALVLGIGLVAGVTAGRRINLLHSTDDGAAALGINARAFRLVLLIGVSLLAGTSVAVAGGIGFVGLIVPQAASFLVGSDARRLLPVAALLGAVFLVLADLAARVVVAPVELPVGAVTAILGGPVFLVMLMRQRRRLT